MRRLTVTISERHHRALKETAARRRMTIGQLIEDSLDRAGVKSREDALEILERARHNAALTMGSMTEGEVEEWAVEQVRQARREREEERGAAASADR